MNMRSAEVRFVAYVPAVSSVVMIMLLCALIISLLYGIGAPITFEGAVPP